MKEAAPTVTDADYDIGTLWVNTATDKAYLIYDNTTGAAVWKQIVTPEELEDLGAGDMLKSVYATNEQSASGYVDKAIAANKLSTPRTMTLSGDVTSDSPSFDGSGNITFTTVLKESVTAGTYTKVTVNSKGIVTGFESLIESDIPQLSHTKITGLGDVATKNAGTASGNVVVVGEDGKIADSILPAIAITDTFEVDSQSAMLGLPAQKGDIAIRSDEDKSYILKQEPASTLENWVLLKTPTDAVLSVNGKTGAVTLTTQDISENGNLYYTEERATANFNTNIAKTPSTSLSDGSKLIRTDDTIILDGGNA